MTGSQIKAALAQLHPFEAEKFRRLDPICLARLLAETISGTARYSKTGQEWMVWDGKVWQKDTKSIAADRLTMGFVKALAVLAAEQSDLPDSTLKVIGDLCDRRRRVSLLQDARTFFPVCAKDFDNRPELFNLQNGVLDLTSGELLHHSPDLMCSRIADVAFDPQASSSTFSNFVGQVLENRTEVISYLQRVLGYTLYGANLHEQFYILLGESTRNGKGTLTGTVEHLFGTYGANAQPETIAKKREANSSAPSGDLARLDGVRYLNMSQPAEGLRLNEALLKTLTGRDTFTARALYEAEREFVPVFRLFLNANSLPIVNDETLFTSGRIKVIRFNKHFTEAERDPTLKARLLEPENLSGALNWMLAGWKAYQAEVDPRKRLAAPQEVTEATEDYRAESDLLSQFMEEALVESFGLNIPAKQLYGAYQKWCRRKGTYSERKKSFYSRLRRRNLLMDHGTVLGRTVDNVVVGYRIVSEYLE